MKIESSFRILMRSSWQIFAIGLLQKFGSKFQSEIVYPKNGLRIAKRNYFPLDSLKLGNLIAFAVRKIWAAKPQTASNNGATWMERKNHVVLQLQLHISRWTAHMLLDGLNNDKKGLKESKKKSRNFHWPCEENGEKVFPLNYIRWQGERRKDIKIMEMEIYFLLLIANFNCTLRTSALHASPGKVGKLSSGGRWPLEARKEISARKCKRRCLFNGSRVKAKNSARICTSHISLTIGNQSRTCRCVRARWDVSGILNFQFHCLVKSFLLKDFVLLFCEVFFMDLYYASLKWKGNWI